MRAYARHIAFSNRARKILTLSRGWRKDSRHLVASPFSCGEVPLLSMLGAPRKNITCVMRAEDILEAEENWPDVHYIADDLPGAAREHPRKLATAMVDAQGTITDAFVDHLRVVLAHGMAEEGALSVTFCAGQEIGAFGEWLRKGVFAFAELCEGDGGAIDAPSMRSAFDRIMALRTWLRDKLNGRTWWDPHYFTFFRNEEDELEVLAYGPVRRKTPSETYADGPEGFDIPVEALQYSNTEEALVRSVRRFYDEMTHHLAADDKIEALEDPKARVVFASRMYNLPEEEVTQWIDKKA